MMFDERSKSEKVQYDLNKEASKTFALSFLVTLLNMNIWQVLR